MKFCLCFLPCNESIPPSSYQTSASKFLKNQNFHANNLNKDKDLHVGDGAKICMRVRPMKNSWVLHQNQTKFNGLKNVVARYLKIISHLICSYFNNQLLINCFGQYMCRSVLFHFKLQFLCQKVYDKQCKVPPPTHREEYHQYHQLHRKTHSTNQPRAAQASVAQRMARKVKGQM